MPSSAGRLAMWLLAALVVSTAVVGQDAAIEQRVVATDKQDAAIEQRVVATDKQDAAVGYRVIATNKTSTTEKEMNEAADDGFRFGGTMAGGTSFGGSEVVTVMCRTPGAEKGRFAYKLLATNRTSTMQKELQEAGDAGYEYKGQTANKTAFGGQEVIVILERDRNEQHRPQFEYKLLATRKTSTMQKELQEAGRSGFEFVGITVANTAFGGAEVVSILRRVRE